MKAKYLVFLDIDGVFTSSRVQLAHNGTYPMWVKFDHNAVDFMNYIHDTYPVEFVIMSTWKELFNDDKAADAVHWVESAFANAGFRGTLANPWKTDPTGYLKTQLGNTRGKEVKDYLDNYAVDIEDFIMFDDNAFDLNHVYGKRRLVKTSDKDGLLYKHMLHAKSIMGEWDKK